MPEFNEGDVSNISGEVVANSSDEEVISEDEVLVEVHTEHFVCDLIAICLFICPALL